MLRLWLALGLLAAAFVPQTLKAQSYIIVVNWGPGVLEQAFLEQRGTNSEGVPYGINVGSIGNTNIGGINVLLPGGVWSSFAAGHTRNPESEYNVQFVAKGFASSGTGNAGRWRSNEAYTSVLSSDAPGSYQSDGLVRPMPLDADGILTVYPEAIWHYTRLIITNFSYATERLIGQFVADVYNPNQSQALEEFQSGFDVVGRGWLTYNLTIANDPVALSLKWVTPSETLTVASWADSAANWSTTAPGGPIYYNIVDTNILWSANAPTNRQTITFTNAANPQAGNPTNALTEGTAQIGFGALKDALERLRGAQQDGNSAQSNLLYSANTNLTSANTNLQAIALDTDGILITVRGTSNDVHSINTNLLGIRTNLVNLAYLTNLTNTAAAPDTNVASALSANYDQATNDASGSFASTLSGWATAIGNVNTNVPSGSLAMTLEVGGQTVNLNPFSNSLVVNLCNWIRRLFLAVAFVLIFMGLVKFLGPLYAQLPLVQNIKGSVNFPVASTAISLTIATISTAALIVAVVAQMAFVKGFFDDIFNPFDSTNTGLAGAHVSHVQLGVYWLTQIVPLPDILSAMLAGVTTALVGYVGFFVVSAGLRVATAALLFCFFSSTAQAQFGPSPVEFGLVTFNVGCGTNYAVWMQNTSNNRLFKLQDGVQTLRLPADTYYLFTYPWSGYALTQTVYANTEEHVHLTLSYGGGVAAPGGLVSYNLGFTDKNFSGSVMVDRFVQGFALMMVTSLLAVGVNSLRSLRMSSDTDL